MSMIARSFHKDTFRDSSVKKTSNFGSGTKLDHSKNEFYEYISEIEKKYQASQSQRDVEYKEFKAKEEALNKNITLIKLEVINSKKEIDEKESTINQMESEVELLKNTLEARGAELFHSKADLTAYIESCSKLSAENQSLKTELESTKSKNLSLKGELENIKILYDKLIDAKSIDLERIHEREFEISNLHKNMEENSIVIKTLSSERDSLLKELKDENLARLSHQQEIDRLIMFNNKKINEGKDLEFKLKESEILNSQLNQKIKDISLSLEIKERDLIETKKLLSDKTILIQEQDQDISILKNEKERLEYQIVETKNELQSTIKLKEEYAFHLNEVTTDKQNIELKLINTEIELKTIKDELSNNSELLNKKQDEFMQLQSEFDALKEHSSVLEHQNYEVI